MNYKITINKKEYSIPEEKLIEYVNMKISELRSFKITFININNLIKHNDNIYHVYFNYKTMRSKVYNGFLKISTNKLISYNINKSCPY